MNDLDRQYGLLAFRAVGEFGAAIALPVVLLSLAGKRMDAAYGTAPRYLILGFVLAALLSAAYVAKRTRELNQEYQRLDAESKRRKEAGEKHA
ncbi:MAG TPA: hypothetical protein VL500_03450 [Candidatus Eisenbacteria bacterium]|jgi:hypothetical protein|nr:hypothetical protein [Candidatus Eisenbacteria bacterium]